MGFYIDLEEEMQISRIRLLWEVAYGRGYKIQVSNDLENWKPYMKKQKVTVVSMNLHSRLLPLDMSGCSERMTKEHNVGFFNLGI